MFGFLTERPRSAHKALQDAFAYLIVLKHKARAGEFDWELANDYNGHEEVWTSIRDLIQAHIVEAFASKTKTLQRIELRRRIIVCEGDRLIYTRFLSREFSDEERQILTDVMFNDRTLKENVAYMFVRSNILLATQLALRHVAQMYFNDSQERDYLFLWRSAYELMVENVMRDKIASARGEAYVFKAMIDGLQSMVAEAEKRAYSGERITVPPDEKVQPKSEQPDIKRQRFYPGEIQEIAEFVFNRFHQAREASLYRLESFQLNKPENVLFIDTTLVWIELEALSSTPAIALAAFKEVLLAVAKLFKASNVQTTDDVLYDVQAEFKKTADAKPEGGWLADFMIIGMMYIYELDPTKFNAIEKRELGRRFADSMGDAWKVLARVRNICGYKTDESWLGAAPSDAGETAPRRPSKRGPKIDLSKYKRGSLATASFEEILEAFQKMPPAVSSDVLIDATQRLIELAYEDASLSDEVRGQAARLADVVIRDTEKAFEGDASRLSAYRAAYQQQLEYAKKFGVGSLAQRIVDLPSDKVISEIIKIENASELANLPREVVERTRAECVRALLRDRIPTKQPLGALDEWLCLKIKHGNAVNIAGWLVLMNDPTATFLFTADERRVLGNYVRDYENARRMLAENEVIAISRPLSFRPIPDPTMVFQFMLRSSMEENTALAEPQRGDERERLVLLDREARQGFQTIVIGFRMFVWQKIIDGIYGQKYLDEVNAVNAGSEGSQLTTSITQRMEALYDLVNNESGERIGFDQLVLADLMHDYIDRTLPETHNDKIVQACTTVFRNEMFYFPPYVRYLLRYLIHGQEKAVEALVEDPII